MPSHLLLHAFAHPCLRADRVLGLEVPHGPEYICLSVMVLVGMGIVVISIYFGFWGRK